MRSAWFLSLGSWRIFLILFREGLERSSRDQIPNIHIHMLPEEGEW